MPPHLKVNPQLWGECLVGALTQEEFLAELERAGFYGLEVLEKSYWKDVEDTRSPRSPCADTSSRRLPGALSGASGGLPRAGKAFVDEEGHQFPRNEPYEICTDTVAKLSNPPYAGHLRNPRAG